MPKLSERVEMASAIVTGYQAIPVLFENDDIIAVDKPEKLASIPERNREKVSLLKILSETLERKLYTVHRLDKQVSGVILFAKTPEAHRQLNLMFEHRQVHKTYMALVHGEITGQRGVIDKPLRCFGSGRMGEDIERGQTVPDRIPVLERMPGYTLVQVNPVDRPQAPDSRPFLRHRTPHRGGYPVRGQVNSKNVSTTYAAFTGNRIH